MLAWRGELGLKVFHSPIKKQSTAKRCPQAHLEICEVFGKKRNQVFIGVNSCQGNITSQYSIILDHHPTSNKYNNVYKQCSCYDGEAKHACDQFNHYKDKCQTVAKFWNFASLNRLKTNIMYLLISIKQVYSKKLLICTKCLTSFKSLTLSFLWQVLVQHVSRLSKDIHFFNQFRRTLMAD